MKSNEITSDIIAGASIASQKENTIKTLKEKIQNGKKSLFKTSSKVKDNISTNIHKKAEETNGFFDTMKNKNTKVNNLENYLGLDKSYLVSSDKTTNVYKPSYGKLVIIEKDVTGDPFSITVKEFSDTSVFVVKYEQYTPYVYPNFDERQIKGKLCYLDKNQVWYRDYDTVTILYKVAHTMHVLVIKLSDIPEINEENMHQTIKNYFEVVNSPSMRRLVRDNHITYNNIMRIKDEYMLIKNEEKGYSVFIYNNQEGGFVKHDFAKLPDIDLSTYDVLFKPDMLSFIIKNDYPLESFEEKNGYIEYNEFIGKNKVCVFRYKI